VNCQTTRFRTWALWTVLAVAALQAWAPSGACVAAQPPEAQASSSPQEPPAAPAGAEAAELRAQAFDRALSGQFSDALAVLRRAKRLGAADAGTARAIDLLGEFLTVKSRVDAERRAEYAKAVARVQRSLAAAEYAPKLAESGLGEKLRKALIENVAEAQGDAATSQSLERAELSDVEDMKDRTTKAIDRQVEELAAGMLLIESDDGEFAGELRGLTAECKKWLTEYRKAWAELHVEKREDLSKRAEEMRDVESKTADALADMAAMVSKETWRTSLYHARLAKDLAPKGEDVAKTDWFRRVIEQTEAVAEQARTDARWRDVLAAQLGLKGLDPYNEAYLDAEKSARGHVRVLGLYGVEIAPPLDPDVEPKPPVEPGPADRPMWKEYVEGIDATMAENTISPVSRSYVTSVDYRKLIRGGLRSIQVLAETPQVAESFAGLKDEAKRADFLRRIAKAAASFDKMTELDHGDLQLALSAVLLASDRTVEVPTAVLSREFTDGYLSELDRFSSMIWPHDYADFRKSTLGEFCGVGVQINKETGKPLRVATPLAGSPAFRAGIKTGDWIMKVDGEETAKHDVDRLVRMITGKKGTKVVLTIKRPGTLKPFDVPVVRDNIEIHTVKGWQIGPEGKWEFLIDPDTKIGYLRLTQFTRTTHTDMAKALGKLRAQGVRAVVLDLRFNPGGLLTSAERVSNEFLDGGQIVSTRGRRQPQDVRRANSSGSYLKGDLIVLVNEYSASAAEIVSGALKDWKRCLVVGSRSYGKGSVQNVISIAYRKAALKLTTAYYYLPSGRLLHRRNGVKDWGVDPDVDVPMTPAQLRRWLDIRSKTDLILDANGSLSQRLAEQLQADIQLLTAVLMLNAAGRIVDTFAGRLLGGLTIPRMT